MQWDEEEIKNLKNHVKARLDNDGILWLNEKRIEEGLDHKIYSWLQ